MASNFFAGVVSGFASKLEDSKKTPNINGLRIPGRRFKLNRIDTFKCSYCLNTYKERYESCPSCGARDFS